MKYKESETIELKKSTSELKEAIISISAILNKHGQGELYFGIKHDGSCLGQDVGSKTLRDVSRAILENIEPKIYPKIQQVTLNNRTCIKLNFQGKDVPYFAFGRAYMRVADEGRQISAREFEHLIIKKNKDKLRCAVFAGTGTAYIIDRKEFEGDIFYLIEKAEEYILENIHMGMRIEGLRRIDVPEIDREALREAIINAFCHRDYREYDSVNIAVFKDRLEIRSPGLLYGGLTIEKVRTETVSERRNELLAELLHRVHFIEKWGRGIMLILSKEPAAKFKEVGSHFIVVFNRKSTTTAEKTTQKTREKTREKILRMIQGNPVITTSGLAESSGLTLKGVEWNIGKMKREGLIQRIGPDKGGYWQAKRKTRG
ncbi:MAG: ATP-binding protein [Candidatus Omnitrophota bacterium]